MKIFKKLLSLAILVLIIFIAISSYSVYKDIHNFSNKFNESSNVFLLLDEDSILAGFVQGPENIELFDSDLVEKNQRYINRKKYGDILGDNYKIFFIDILAFEEKDNFELVLQESDIVLRSVMFSELVNEKLENDIMFFFSEYKRDNIEVYPKTALFKFIDFIPTSYLKKIIEKIKIKASHEIESFIKNRTEEII